jgi:Flp pilus assembly protein TadD
MMPRSRAAALRAIELDPALAEARALLAIYLALFEYDWPAAEREFHRALALNPESPAVRTRYAHFYLRPKGRLKEDVLELERGLQQDPLSLLLHTRLGYALHLAGDSETAILVLRKASELSPDAYMPHLVLGSALAVLGRIHAAMAESIQAVELSRRNPFALALLGFSRGMGGRREDVERIQAEFQPRTWHGVVAAGPALPRAVGAHESQLIKARAAIAETPGRARGAGASKGFRTARHREAA